MTDGQLVRQALGGAASAYEALVRRWTARVVGVCHARVGSAAAAEDLAQETLLRGLRALPTLAEPEKFGPWLCGIASRTCLDWLKRAERSEVSLAAADDGAARFAAEGGDAATDAERADDIHRLMREVEIEETATVLVNATDRTYRHLRRAHDWDPERSRGALIDLVLRGLLPG